MARRKRQNCDGLADGTVATSVSIEGEAISAQTSTPLYAFTPENVTDPRSYVTAVTAVMNASGRGDIKPMDADRHTGILMRGCEANTGIAYEDATKSQQDPLLNTTALFERSETELLAFQKAYHTIDERRLGEGLKKKWDRIIAGIIEIQRQARDDPAKFAVYVHPNDDPGKVGQLIDVQPFHLRFYDVWNDPHYQHSLIEAPVGHAKSTHFRCQIMWEIGREPSLRHLYLMDQRDKVRDVVLAIKRVIQGRRYRAIFPNVRILKNSEDAVNSSISFTVVRPNIGSRDPTFLGASITSKIQGIRFDRGNFDDIVPQEAVDQDSIRRDINNRWSSVVQSRIADALTSRMRVIGTPTTKEDVYYNIERGVANRELRSWRVEIEPFKIKLDPDKKPISIWPDKFPTAFLIEQMMDRRAFARNYALESIADSKRVIQRVYYYNSETAGQYTTDADRQRVARLAEAEHWISIDPGGTASKWSSDSGVLEISLTPSGVAAVSKVWFMHAAIGEVVERLVQIILDAGPGYYTGIHWESQGAVKVGMPMVVDGMRRRLVDKGFNPDSLQWVSMGLQELGLGGWQNASKPARLAAISRYLEHGCVQFAGCRKRNNRTMQTYLGAIDGSDMAKLTDAILTFDGRKSADAVDALTQWVLRNRNRLKTPEQVQQMARDAERGSVQPNTSSRLTQLFQTQIQSILDAAKERIDGSEHQHEHDFFTRRQVA